MLRTTRLLNFARVGRGARASQLLAQKQMGRGALCRRESTHDTENNDDEWKGIWTWGFGGCMLVGFVIAVARPDTSINTWAYNEAKKNIESKGIDLSPKS